jgi:hypothetical protein
MQITMFILCLSYGINGFPSLRKSMGKPSISPPSFNQVALLFCLHFSSSHAMNLFVSTSNLFVVSLNPYEIDPLFSYS